MATTWNLRSVLKERGINRASEISRLICDRTGYQLSTQAVCDLLNTEPKMIRLETIQAFCDAFYFRLSDVLDVFPSAAEKRRKKIGNQDYAAFYPNARDYSSESRRGE